MNHRKTAKPYAEMNIAELREATAEFNAEHAADGGKPLPDRLKARWKRAKNKKPSQDKGQADRIISVRLDETLLERCTALAKKKRLSRDDLVARGLRVLLAAEGES